MHRQPQQHERSSGSKMLVTTFSREMRSDHQGLGGPERFDRICELLIAAVLWMMVLGLGAYPVLRMLQ